MEVGPSLNAAGSSRTPVLAKANLSYLIRLLAFDSDSLPCDQFERAVCLVLACTLWPALLLSVLELLRNDSLLVLHDPNRKPGDETTWRNWRA